jgi:NAD(P)H-hydrate epimerase
MREAEKLSAASGDLYPLMECAGAAVAERAFALAKGGPVLVLCGPGNNGGDGYVAARLLAKRRVNVRLAAMVPPKSLTGDARRAAQMWKGLALPFDTLEINPRELVIDAVFGAGLSKPLEGPVPALFAKIRKAGNAVLAVDVPSGVDGDNGRADPHALAARETVAFFRKRPGHVLMPGKELCGDVHVADIGIDDSVLAKTGFTGRENGPALWRSFAGPKKAGSNKYDYGHLVVYGGKRLTGAACLAGQAALRMGAGLCGIAAHPEAMNIYRAYSPLFMVESCETPASFVFSFGDARRNAALIGPGAGTEEGGALRQAVTDICMLDPKRGCVIDADALTVFADNRHALYDALGDHCVITPHEGEFARIFPDLKGLKHERALAAAKLCGAVVLLKGADTVIAHPDGRFAVNTNAPPALATGGSGDVLAGMIAGLLARHVPPFEAACAAAWIHGEAARRFGEGLIATDIIAGLPAVLDEEKRRHDKR